MMQSLDEAFDRMAASSSFELPNGFVNHGPMGCEALVALGCEDRVEEWARRFERVPGPAVEPVPTARLEWRESLGDYRLLPEWIGHFGIAIDEDGWRDVVALWVPRLLPALSSKLFHGAIHTAHAVRALTARDTPSRRAELARALGYWAARYQPGESPAPATGEVEGDLRNSVTAEAAAAARRYLAAPSILALHGVTGAMAVELMVDHLPDPARRDALAQLRAEHDALYRGVVAVSEVSVAGATAAGLAAAAAASGDVHQVKLVEACRRGSALTGDPAFAAAAEVVTGLVAG